MYERTHPSDGMKYLQKTFSVAMPGNEARQWPRCESVSPATQHVCQLDLGHKGLHEYAYGDGDHIYWRGAA